MNNELEQKTSLPSKNFQIIYVHNPAFRRRNLPPFLHLSVG